MSVRFGVNDFVGNFAASSGLELEGIWIADWNASPPDLDELITHFKTKFRDAGEFGMADTVAKVREKWTDVLMERGTEEPGD